MVKEGPGRAVAVDVWAGVAVVAGGSVCAAVGWMVGVAGVTGAQALTRKRMIPQIFHKLVRGEVGFRNVILDAVVTVL